MITDVQPRKVNRAGFLESERIKTFDLPQDGRLLSTTKSIESAMKSDRIADVRSACAEFLAIASEFLRSPCLRCPGPCSPTAASSRTVDDRTLRGLQSRNHADPGLDADGGSQGSHVIRYVREHALPRVLPSSRFSEVRIPRLMAHSRILRASGCALPSCERNATEATVLGARDTGALED